jgi:murein DD-endopeptidase MepM/ murein hydrolase activator NlpD
LLYLDSSLLIKYRNPPTCRPVSRTANSINQLASQGILQATNTKTIPNVFTTNTKWGHTSTFKGKTKTFGRGATPLERTNSGGDGGHEGIDQPLGTGSNLLAVADGRIAYILSSCAVGDRWCGNAWGNQIVIDHGQSRFSRYAHTSAVNVK